MTQRTIADTPITHNATNVLFAVCFGVGHTTFFSSLFISRNHLPIRFWPLLFFLAGFADTVCSIFSSDIENKSFPAAVRLLRLAVRGVFTTETAILVHFKTIRGVLLVFHCIVVSLFAFVASKCDFYSHRGASISIASLL